MKEIMLFRQAINLIDSDTSSPYSVFWMSTADEALNKSPILIHQALCVDLCFMFAWRLFEGT